MLRYLPVLLSLALTVYCVVDALQTDGSRVRNLPEDGLGPHHPHRPPRRPDRLARRRAAREADRTASAERRRRWEDEQRARDARRPRGPDDDPDFLKGL